MVGRALNGVSPEDECPDAARAKLGRALKVTGLLEMAGEIRIDGHVLGRIKADSFVLSRNGCVEGDVIARTARIAGRFIGRIFALHVTLDASANITGRVFHHAVVVAKGARIDGRMPWRPLNYFETLILPPEEGP